MESFRLVKQRWHIPRPSDKAESCRNGLHRVLEYVLKDRKDIAEGISGLTRYQAKLLWMERAWMALSDWEFDPKVYEVRLDSLASKLIAETMEAKERNPSTKKKLQKVTFNVSIRGSCYSGSTPSVRHFIEATVRAASCCFALYWTCVTGRYYVPLHRVQWIPRALRTWTQRMARY